MEEGTAGRYQEASSKGRLLGIKANGRVAGRLPVGLM